MNPAPTSLDLLHDVIAPPPAPWWPPAPGWYGVIAIVAVLLVVFAARDFLRWQHNRYRREALADWKKQAGLLVDKKNRAAALGALAVLLKRAALSAWPRPAVAALTGPAWFAFLDRTGRTDAFGRRAGGPLERALYRPKTVGVLSEGQVHDAAEAVRRWLAHHDANLEPDRSAEA